MARHRDPSSEPKLREAVADSQMSVLMHAEYLVDHGRGLEVVPMLEALLADLSTAPALPLAQSVETPHPPVSVPVAAAWEEAGRRNGGDPVAVALAQAAVVRWRANTLLAHLTGDLRHFHEAALARPDAAATRAALGCALARAGHLADAASHLRVALAADPLDLSAARALYQVLLDLGEGVAAARFVRDRHRLRTVDPDRVPAETWLAAGPAGDELTSVVVLCCNKLEHTRRCLESVIRNTRPPFELVVIDVGSTDGTPAYLAGLAASPGPARVEVVTTPGTLGFAVGANRGFEAARGEYVVLLSNDAVVPPRWLDRLVDALLAGRPGVGLVGPVSNHAPPPQYDVPGYDDVARLDAFAAGWWQAHRGRTVDAARLSGFCLLAHRPALVALGPLDERFSPGFFEDDWCAQARRLGIGMRVAVGVYVHRDGSRTGAGPGMHADDLLADNLARFRDKWGEEAAARCQLPDAVPAEPRGRPRVSLTMIVRDEAHNLPACLGGVRGVFDEVVVVDTGSGDRTRQVAAAHGAKVSEFRWVDDFAAARTAALDRATGDYAFWLDADDRVAPGQRDRLAELLAGLTSAAPTAWVVKCRCVADRPGGPETVVDHVRLFPRVPGVRWEFRVHEQILPSLRRAGVPVKWSDAEVSHVGYADPAVRRRKLDRDLRLLGLDLAERPGHPFVLFNLGAVYLELGDADRAADHLERSLVGSDPRDSIVRKAWALLASCHRRRDRPADALAAVRVGRTHYPKDAELLYLEGTLSRFVGDEAGAERAFRELAAGGEGDHFASVDPGLRAKVRDLSPDGFDAGG